MKIKLRCAACEKERLIANPECASIFIDYRDNLQVAGLMHGNYFAHEFNQKCLDCKTDMNRMIVVED